jgi:glycosyltransferase involved in cell wall biosynthesis
MEKCHLSIAMCTYNGARFLAEQLESIATQTRLPDELIVCDDRSSDETVQMVQAFSWRAPFPVELVVNEQNLGSTKNFEKAISICRGDVIALSDQDDIWYASKLERIEAIFTDRASVGVVFSDADVVDENQVALGYRLGQLVEFGPAERKDITNGRGTEVLLNHNVVTGATMAFRAKFRDQVLPIPRCWVHDAWIVLFVSVIADLAVIDEPLIRYRRHAEQQIGPPNFTIAERFARANKTGADHYRALAEQFGLARERLSTTSDSPRIKAVIPHFEMKVKHLKARAQMDTKRLSRLPRILEELLSCRYHRYSRGWKSAAKDLLLKPE